MSKFLSLCNELVSVPSTCGEATGGGERDDKLMRVSGLLHKAKLTDDELKYGMAVVSDGFDFEVRLQQRARVILALSMTLSEDKLALRSAGLAELVMMYIRGQTKGRAMETMAQQAGFKRRTWHRHKTVYLELCDWCNDLESEANIKVWRVLEKESKLTLAPSSGN